MRIELTSGLLQRLRAVQARQPWQDDVVAAEDAFLLDPGLGPALYLTADGRVLVDGRAWDGEPVREATDDEATCALVVGAKKMGIPELLELVPTAPVDASTCRVCGGARWAELAPGAGHQVVCSRCHGRGWRRE